jgi:hypothetical protein
MKTYYAFKNKNNQHKQDPDYFVFLPKNEESDKGRLVGKIYRNKSKEGNQFLKIIIFGEDENIHQKEDLCNKEN